MLLVCLALKLKYLVQQSGSIKVADLNGSSSRPSLGKKASTVNISDEVVKSGVWLHVNQKKASVDRYFVDKTINQDPFFKFYFCFDASVN